MDLIEIEQKLVAQSTHYPVDLPPAQSGGWRIFKNTVSEMSVAIENLRKVRDNFPEGVVTPGIEYTVLAGPCGEGGSLEVMMSNTQLEYRTNKAFVDRAHGDVLMVGLGIGMLIKPLTDKPEVKSLTVIEKEPDVIAMVKPHYEKTPKLRIFEANAHDFEPGDLMGNLPDRWDCVLLDIWPNISSDNLREMKKLHGRYAQWLNEGGFVKCWSEDLARRQKREEDAFMKQLRRSA